MCLGWTCISWLVRNALIGAVSVVSWLAMRCVLVDFLFPDFSLVAWVVAVSRLVPLIQLVTLTQLVPCVLVSPICPGLVPFVLVDPLYLA